MEIQSIHLKTNTDFQQKIDKLNTFLEENKMRIIDTDHRGLIFYDEESKKYFRQIHDGITELHIVGEIPFCFENNVVQCNKEGIVL